MKCKWPDAAPVLREGACVCARGRCFRDRCPASLALPSCSCFALQVAVYDYKMTMTRQ